MAGPLNDPSSWSTPTLTSARSTSSPWRRRRRCRKEVFELSTSSAEPEAAPAQWSVGDALGEGPRVISWYPSSTRCRRRQPPCLWPSFSRPRYESRPTGSSVAGSAGPTTRISSDVLPGSSRRGPRASRARGRATRSASPAAGSGPPGSGLRCAPGDRPLPARGRLCT